MPGPDGQQILMIISEMPPWQLSFVCNFFRLLENNATFAADGPGRRKALSSGKVPFNVDSLGSALLNKVTVLDGRKIALLIASIVNIFVEGAITSRERLQ
jgi:hypothetical protein